MDQEQLVTGLCAQDPAAVQDLFDSCGDRLLRSAFLLCGDQTEAEDIVQETFVQAIRSAHRFRGRSSIYTWLHAILLNVTRHYHRERKRIVYDDELAHGEAAAPEENQSRLDIETTSSALLEALQALSSTHREVIVLRYYENMKLRQIAGQLGISTGTVKSRLHYAIVELQKLLPGEMNLFGTTGTEKMERS